MSDDWLDTETPVHTDRMAAVRAQRTGPTREKYIPAKHDNSTASKRKELLTLKREMTFPHRDYVECMTQSGFHISNANTAMLLKGYAHDRSSYTRWRAKPRMRRALELAEELALEDASITAGKIIGRVNKLSEHSLDEIPIRDRNGNLLHDEDGVPLRMMRNPELALKANELLGKHKKLWGNDQDQTRVTVQIVNLSGEQEINAEPLLDGEFSRVAEDDN